MSLKKKNSFSLLQDSYLKDLLRRSSVKDARKKKQLSLVKLSEEENQKEKNCIFYVIGYDRFEVKNDEKFQFSRIGELKEYVKDNIRKVRILNCGIKKLPLELKQFPRITQLILKENNIFSLKSKFFLKNILPHLRILNLDSNHIKALESEFYTSAGNIETLKISKNQLEEISPLIKNLRKLRVLHINNNAFTSLPIDITELALEELKLDWLEYLDPPLKNPLEGNQSIRKFQKKLSSCNQARISIKEFPLILTGKNEFDIKKKAENSLCRAVYKSDLGMIQHISQVYPELLKIKNEKDYDPYNYALAKGNIKAFTTLMNIDDQFPLYSKKFGSGLHLAIRTGNLKIIEYLIKKKKIDLDVVDSMGNTALHIAFLCARGPSIEKFHKIIELLLNENIDLNKYNFNGETPLLAAIKNDSHYPFLIAEAWNGDEVDIANSKYRAVRQKFNFSLEDKKTGKTCLHYIAKLNFIGLTNLVLYHAPNSSFKVDNNFKLPKEYKKKDFLVSKKSLEKQYRIFYNKHTLENKFDLFCFGKSVPLFKKIGKIPGEKKYF